MFRYVVCSDCPTISRLSPEENSCTFCGHDLEGCKEVTEREWRHYWIGILGQYPPVLHPAKKSEQSHFKKYERSSGRKNERPYFL